MNNLKRVLSLALSGIMLVGMMAMGASAAEFTDAEKIEHDDAVNVLVALNVINGKDDGSFDPQGNVTRAEMAKMIAVAMNGGKDTNTGVKGTATFTDIKGHWAESYIEYCYDMGIISGRGDGTFDPGANVTGLEATKMVLTALGYDSEAYKLTGASWAVRTDELAKQADPKLYEELETVVMANVASRDTAAQLIWNGLQNWTKRITPQQNTNTGEVTFIYGNGSGTLLKERYDADIVYGTYVGNYNTNGASGIMKGEIAVRETYSVTANGNTTTSTRTHCVPSELGIENIGEEVKVIYKDARSSKSGPDRQDTIYGVFNTGKTEVVTATKADITKSGDQPSAADKFKVNGTEYTLATPATGDILVEKNYDSTQRDTASAAAVSELKTALVALQQDQNGDTIKFVCDADGKIKTAYVVESKIAAVTAINSTKITLNNTVGTVTVADGDVEEGLKKGDVVVATTLYKAKATDDGAYVIVKKAETVTGAVTGYKNNDDVKVDGKAYKIFQKSSLLNAIPDENNVITSFNTSDNTYIDEDVTLYMVNGYVGAAVQNSESASNYSLVTEVKGSASAGSTFTGLQLQVMDGDGVKHIISVSKDSKDVRLSVGDGVESNNAGTALTSSDLSNVNYKKVIDQSDYCVGDIITYTLDKNNEADVTVEDMVAYSKAAYSSDDTKFAGTQTTTSAVIFVQTESLGDMSASNKLLLSGATYKAYNIRDLKGFAAANVSNGMAKVVKDGKVVAAFVNMGQGKDPAGATSNTVYGIVSKADGRVKDYFAYEVQSNGETYTVNSKDGDIKKGDLVFFDKTNDDNYSSGDVKILTAAYSANSITAEGVYTKELEEGKAVTFYSAKAGSAGNYTGIRQDTYALDDDVKIVYVDQDDDTSAGESTVGPFDSVTGYMNALIVTENYTNDASISTERVLAIFVEISNECNVVNGTATKTATISSTTDKKLSAQDVKDAGAGVVRAPADADASDKTAFPGTQNASVQDLVFFNVKSTAASQAVTLTVKNSAGTTVYTEQATLSADATMYTFYVDTKVDASGGSVTRGGTWAQLQANQGVYMKDGGVFSYTITIDSDSSVLANGEFVL